MSLAEVQLIVTLWGVGAYAQNHCLISFNLDLSNKVVRYLFLEGGKNIASFSFWKK